MAMPMCEECAPGYDLVDGRCVARKPPAPAPTTPGFAPVPPVPPPPPPGCLAAARRVCVDKTTACGKRIANAIARCRASAPPAPAVRPPKTTPAVRPAPVVTVPRVTRPLPGVPGGEIVEGGEAPASAAGI
jgi:hypothetical protein